MKAQKIEDNRTNNISIRLNTSCMNKNRYLATAQKVDEIHSNRIDRHEAQRNSRRAKR